MTDRTATGKRSRMAGGALNYDWECDNPGCCARRDDLDDAKKLLVQTSAQLRSAGDALGYRPGPLPVPSSAALKQLADTVDRFLEDVSP